MRRGCVRTASSRRRKKKGPAFITTGPSRLGSNSVILLKAHSYSDFHAERFENAHTIAAGSVVTSDVPAWTIVAGNPAKVIRPLTEDERAPEERA